MSILEEPFSLLQDRHSVGWVVFSMAIENVELMHGCFSEYLRMGRHAEKSEYRK